jgi:hypothetical protein
LDWLSLIFPLQSDVNKSANSCSQRLDLFFGRALYNDVFSFVQHVLCVSRNNIVQDKKNFILLTEILRG